MEIITGQITEYNEYRNQVAELVKANEQTVFDYESEKGEKEARSYVYKLRQSKSAIDKKRKELGADLVERKRLIDGEAKTLIEAVDGMIDVHMKPLEEKAERERIRLEEIERKMQFFGEVESSCVGADSNFIKEAINTLENHLIEGFDERTEEAQSLQYQTLERLSKMLDDATRVERERAELDRLRKEAAEREEAERKRQEEERAKAERERIQKEAAEKAEREAREAHQRELDRLEAEKHAAIKAEQEKARKEREAFECKALAEKQEAERKERERIAAEQEQKRIAEEARIAEEKRQADVNHRKSINTAALNMLIEHAGITHDQAKDVVTAIVQGLIPNVSIRY